MTDTFNQWKDTLVILVSASTQFRQNSAKYEATYEVLQQLSAAWMSTNSTVQMLSVYWDNAKYLNLNYDNTYNTVNALSTFWTFLGPEGTIYTMVYNNSSYWQAVSAFFETALPSIYNDTYTTLRTNSATYVQQNTAAKVIYDRYKSTSDTVSALSANWQSTYEAIKLPATTSIVHYPAQLHATGRNDWGELGLGDYTNRNTFTALTGNWSQLSPGYIHTVALSAGTNKWFGTGANYYPDFSIVGSYGLGEEEKSSVFVQLTGDWSQMIAGINLTMAQSANTTQWFATGFLYDGQFGIYFTPLTGNWDQMVLGKNIASSIYTMALSAGTDKWFATGENSDGQLGLGDNTGRNTFAALTGNWSQMVCGGEHTMALSAGTTKWFGTGNNTPGCLGLGDNTNRNTFAALTGNWSQMVCGYDFFGTGSTMALSAGTTKWFATGYNEYGQLGLEDNTNRNTFTALTGTGVRWFVVLELTWPYLQVLTNGLLQETTVMVNWDWETIQIETPLLH